MSIAISAWLLSGCGASLRERRNPRSKPQSGDSSQREQPSDGYRFLDGCEEAPATDIVEIAIEREAGCNGYFLPPGAKAGAPFFLTGPCAEYQLRLYANGSAEYVGFGNVPLLGHHSATVAVKRVMQLARLVNEIGFERWRARYPDAAQGHTTGWTCIAMDGEGPVTISIKRKRGQKQIRFDPNYQAPAWLRVLASEIDRIGEDAKWQ